MINSIEEGVRVVVPGVVDVEISPIIVATTVSPLVPVTLVTSPTVGSGTDVIDVAVAVAGAPVGAAEAETVTVTGWVIVVVTVVTRPPLLRVYAALKILKSM